MTTREENLKKINEELEHLSDEQLDRVAGGVRSETNKDKNFLKALHLYAGNTRETFSQYGVDVTNNLFSSNYYKMGGDQKYPRAAALGFVLAKMNYPG